MSEKTMIQVEREVWDYIRKWKWLGDRHTDFLKYLIEKYEEYSKICEVCGNKYHEDDLDMVNGKWLCRGCEGGMR